MLGVSWDREKQRFFSFNKECFNKEFCFAEHPEFIFRVLLRNPGCHMSEGLHQGMEKLEQLPSDSWISLVKVDFEGIKPQHLQAALIVGWVSSQKESIVIALRRGRSSWWACRYRCRDIERGPGACRRASRATVAFTPGLGLSWFHKAADVLVWWLAEIRKKEQKLLRLKILKYVD